MIIDDRHSLSVANQLACSSGHIPISNLPPDFNALSNAEESFNPDNINNYKIKPFFLFPIRQMTTDCERKHTSCSTLNYSHLFNYIKLKEFQEN